MVKKEFLFLLTQFLLFALYFLNIQLVPFSWPEWFQYVLAIPIALAIVIIFLGIFHLNDNLSYEDSGKQGIVFEFRGIYNYIRHPVYAGIILAMTSYAVLSVSIFKLIVTVLLTVVFYVKSNYEEKWLLKRYEHFRQYKQRTGRFFPKLGHHGN